MHTQIFKNKMSSSDLVDLSGGRLERLISDLHETADVFYREREDALQRLAAAEFQLNNLQSTLQRSKQEQMDMRETLATREKKLQEERASALLESERIKTSNEELKARLESFRFQNEQLQKATAATVGSSGMPTTNAGQQQQQRISNLVTKEVIDQLNAVHDALKALEARTLQVGASTKLADNRAMETSKTVENSTLLVQKAHNEVALLRTQLREANQKSRADAASISSLQLDLEVAQEETNRLREEVASLVQARRQLESELDKTKATIASSLMPLLESARSIVTTTTSMEVISLQDSASQNAACHDDVTVEEKPASSMNALVLYEGGNV